MGVSDIERNGLLDKGYLKLFTWCLCPVPVPAPERKLIMVSRVAPAPTQILVFLQCSHGHEEGMLGCVPTRQLISKLQGEFGGGLWP